MEELLVVVQSVQVLLRPMIDKHSGLQMPSKISSADLRTELEKLYALKKTLHTRKVDPKTYFYHHIQFSLDMIEGIVKSLVAYEKYYDQMKSIFLENGSITAAQVIAALNTIRNENSFGLAGAAAIFCQISPSFAQKIKSELPFVSHWSYGVGLVLATKK